LIPASLNERWTCVQEEKRTISRTYVTPVGNVCEKYKAGLALTDWPYEWVIKDIEDYDIVKYIIENTEYFARYEDFLRAENVLGDDGIVAAITPKSPLQSMLLNLMGYKRFFLDARKQRKEFDDLFRVLTKKQLEMYQVVADSPAEVVLCDDNINGIVTNPTLFENYVIPFYDKVIQILHSKNKIFMVHCDGKLRSLKDLIGKSKIDVVEAFTPPPVGDLPLKEAKTAWKDKIIWANFPATPCLEKGMGRVEKEAIDILRSAEPGNGFALGITEDIGDIKTLRFEKVLKTIAETIRKHGTYPIKI